MDRVALDFGIIQIYWYSIIIFVAMIVGCYLIHKEFVKRGLEEEFYVNLTFNTIIFGILGARLYYVLFNLKYYLANPIEIFQIWNGGLAIHGGILAGLIFIIIYCKRKKVYVTKVLDMIVVGLIIGQSIGRWGNFFNKEAFGAITTLERLQEIGLPKFVIDGMYIMGEYRQPTFFYESLWCFFGFIAMLMIRRCKNLKRGQLTGFYLVWYGILRFWIESMRTDSLMLGPIKIAQVVSIIFVFAGIILLLKNKNNLNKKLYSGPNKTYEDENAVNYN